MTALIGSLNPVQNAPLCWSGRASCQSPGHSCGHWLVTAWPICGESGRQTRLVLKRKERPSVSLLPPQAQPRWPDVKYSPGRGASPLAGHLLSHLHRPSSPPQ